MLSKHGYTGSCKALMGRKGIDLGPARFPQVSLTDEQTQSLFAMLDTLDVDRAIVGRP
jgi:hypothetical protein